jgi:hypothetical protein
MLVLLEFINCFEPDMFENIAVASLVVVVMVDLLLISKQEVFVFARAT